MSVDRAAPPWRPFSRPPSPRSLVGVSACTGSSGEVESTGKPAVMAAFYPLEYLATRIAGDDLVVIPLTSPGARTARRRADPRTIADLPWRYSSSMPKASSPPSTMRSRPQPATAPSTSRRLPGSPRRAAARPTTLLARPGAVRRSRDRSRGAAGQRRSGARCGLHLPRGGPGGRAHRPQRSMAHGHGTCQIKDLVTSHAAFGYLGRPGFTQVPIAGVSPTPSPAPQTRPGRRPGP